MTAKPRRAPRGYTRGAVQEFVLRDNDGHSLPPIKVQCYLHKASGSVLGFGLSNLADGQLERPNMKEWRDAVAKVLRSRYVSTPSTRHIAVVSYHRDGTYRLAFWPVWRQIAMDGTEHWSELITADQSGGCLRQSEEIWWKEPRTWSSIEPWVWDDKCRKAKILDWSPETWDTLVAVRRSLDDAIARIGELVTDPAALTAHAQNLLGGGDG